MPDTDVKTSKSKTASVWLFILTTSWSPIDSCEILYGSSLSEELFFTDLSISDSILSVEPPKKFSIIFSFSSFELPASDVEARLNSSPDFAGGFEESIIKPLNPSLNGMSFPLPIAKI